MDDQKLQALIHPLVEIAHRAGGEILTVYRTDFDVRYKDDKSPLTEADMAAHHLIVDALKQLTPEIPILSEESADISWDERKQWSTYWLVDPLDGTREFLNRTDEFTVNIALIEGHEVVLGIVGVPVTGDFYWGSKSIGARHKDDQGRVIQLSASKPASPLRVLASKSHLNEETRVYIDNLGPVELVQAGSSLKICRIAEGRADLYPRLGPTSEWDTAAAHGVLEGAGGKLCLLNGEPLLYNTKENLLNPHFVASGASI